MILASHGNAEQHVSKSSTEVEYHAMPSPCSVIIWLDELLHDFGMLVPSATSFNTDNLNAIHIMLSKQPLNLFAMGSQNN